MKEYFESISECVGQMTEKMEEYQGSAVDAHPIMSNFTFEVISQVGFGKSYNAILDPENCAFMQNFEKLTEYQSDLKTQPLHR